jgi:formylglycine-generating enzyme
MSAAVQIPEFDFALIPSGTFLMGSEEGQDEERPVHRVYVDAFEMGVFQVRNCDFAIFLQATGQPEPPHWNDPDLNHSNQPFVGVSWLEANNYCDWLSGLSGRRYRLPTEAEWERAARGGYDGSTYPWRDEPPCQCTEYVRRWTGQITGPLPVGEGTPNPYGLRDVSENVHEWCADWYDRNYYARSSQRNPQGPATGERRASRGGAWRHHVKVSRCAARSSIPPTFKYLDYGFRVVRELVAYEKQ